MDNTRGIYVGLRVLGGANFWIDLFNQGNKIPEVGTDKERRRHVTVIYSRVYADIEPRQNQLYQGYGKELKVFDEPDGRRCLVMLLDAPKVVLRHQELLERHPQLTYDFPEYLPHITLSYDIGDFDEKALKLPGFATVLGEEYVEDINLGDKK